MQFSRNTSIGNFKKSWSFLIKVSIILTIIIVAIVMLGKIDFPAPNKAIEKNIPNAKLKVVK